jgi:hypothetical protein
MYRVRSGPSPLVIVLVGALLVFGGYFVWIGFLGFLEDQGDITANATRESIASATARAAPPALIPTFYMPATFTPLPPCQWFAVSVERAVYRECPSQDNRDCPIRDVILYGTELCVYSRAPGNPEWYVVELNPNGAYRDTVFIHESVVKAVNPTATPGPTVTPLPTTRTAPTDTPAPPSPMPPAPSPNATITLNATITPTPEATPSLPPDQIEI